MSATNDPLLKSITIEEQMLEKRLALLREMKVKLAAIDGMPIPSLPFGRNSHAPAGALKKAVLAALKGAGKIMSKDLRDRVVEAGWDRRINKQYFTKTLKALVEDGVVRKVPNGGYSQYELKR